MIMLDKLAYSSVIRHRNTGSKWAFAMGALLIVVGFRTPVTAIVTLVVMTVVTLKYSSISTGRYLKLMLAPFFFLLTGTLVIAFDITGDGPVWTMESLGEAGRLVIVALSSVSCLYFLTLTTPVMDSIHLLKKIHCPWILMELMIMIYRYIFVLMDIAKGISTAQKCRLGNINMKTSIKSTGSLMAQLLIISLHKSRLIFDAMESRCYDGKLQVLFYSTKPRAVDVAVTLVTVTGLASLGIYEKFFGGFFA